MQVLPSDGKSSRAWVSYKVDPILQSLCSPYFHFVSKTKYLGKTLVLALIVWLPSHFPESFISRLKLDLVEHDHIEAILMLIISILYKDFPTVQKNESMCAVSRAHFGNLQRKKKNLQPRVTGVHQNYTEYWKVACQWCQAGGHVPCMSVTVTWSEGVMTPTSFRAVYRSVRSAVRTYRKKDHYFRIWIKNFQQEQNKIILQVWGYVENEMAVVFHISRRLVSGLYTSSKMYRAYS